MSEQKKPRMPRGLGSAGQRLWRTTLDEFALEAEPHKVEILTQACRVVDKIAELEKAQTGQPLTVLGSARQITIHPLIAEVRFQQGGGGERVSWATPDRASRRSEATCIA